MDMLIMSISLGTFVGIVMGLTGAGGGILAVPLLVFGLHLTIVEAGPVAMLAVGISAAAGALIGLKANILDWLCCYQIAQVDLVRTLRWQCWRNILYKRSNVSRHVCSMANDEWHYCL